MRLSILFLLAVLPTAGFAQQPTAADAAKRDLQAAQGTWELIRYERQGKVWGPEGIAREFEKKGRELLLRFEGDKLFLGEDKNEKPYRLRRGGATEDHTFWLDPTKTPSRCDLSFESGIFSRGMSTYEGIYRLQGDRLEICVAHHPDTRPTQFLTDKDHEWQWLLVYRRVPPPKK